MRDVVTRFGRIPAGEIGRRTQTKEPEQLGQRRVTVSKSGTTAYLKIAHHAPSRRRGRVRAAARAGRGAHRRKGVSTSGPASGHPRRSAAPACIRRSSTPASPPASAAASSRRNSHSCTRSRPPRPRAPRWNGSRTRLSTAIDRVARDGITPQELTKAKTQLRARLVFENDSITNIAHQLGYFATIGRWQDFHALAGRIEAVTLDQVGQVAARRLGSMSRTIGWFSPVEQ